MKTIKKLSVLFFLFFLFTNSFGQNFRAVTNAKDVIENAIEAMGGKDYLLSIKTLYTDIKTEMEGREVHWITKEMLPNKGAFQIVYNDRVVFENWFDGKVGYEVVNGEKKIADPAEFTSKKFKKNIFNEFDFLDSTLWTIELVGEEKVENENCYKIKATLVTGEVRNIYYSKTTFYTLREDKIVDADKNSFNSTYFSDYKLFGKITYYSTMKFNDDGKVQVAKIISLLVNEKVSIKDF